MAEPLIDDRSEPERPGANGRVSVPVSTGRRRPKRGRAATPAATTHLLFELTRALAGVSTREDVARVAIRHGRAAVGAPRGYLYVRSPDGSTADAVLVTGYPRGTREHIRHLPLTQDRPVCRAIRTGEEHWIEDLEDTSAVGRDAAAGQTGTRGTVSLPLVHHRRIVGAVGYSFTEPRVFDEDERALVRAIAGLVAQALERVLLTEAREALVADLERQRARLAAVLRQIPGAVFLVDAESRELVLASTMALQLLGIESAEGMPTTQVGLRGFRPDGSAYEEPDWPVNRALERGERTDNEEISITYPDGGTRTILASAAPVLDPAGHIEAGVVAFTDITERRQALVNQEYLAQMGAVLASSLDYEETLRAIARHAVPRIADWCSIALLEGGELRQLVVEHPDPRKAELARDLRRRYPIDMTSDVGAAGVVRTGEPQLMTEIPQALIDAAATTEELRIILDELGLQSLMCVPLHSRDGPLGAITLVGAESGRRFGPDDLVFAQALAARASSAIENARLYRDADRFRRMVDAHVDVVLLFDPDTLRVAYANHGAAAAVGRPVESIVGRPVAELFNDADTERLQELVRPIADGGAQARTLVLRLAGIHGDIPVEVLVQGVRLPGEPLAALAIARDVSERLETQARLRRLAEAEHARAAELNAVIRAMGDGVLVLAPDGTVTLANPALRALLGGRSPATYTELLAAFDDPAGAPALGTRGGPTELRLAGPDERWIELATYPVTVLPGQERRETIVVARDITDIRLSQALRETFVGVLSHELRTPITTIFGGTKLLARNGNLPDDARQAIFTDISVEAERLHRLVEDVIALQRYGEDGIEIGHEPVLVQRILPAIVAAEEGRWPGARFSVEIPAGLPTVVADPTYVEQVVRNLLSNAAKYGGHGVHVRTVVDADGDEVQVRILDDGPGFQDDETDRLFELYFRSPHTATRVSGAGIGLFVCA
ncbi:MAG: GAF domain-containing protein, partial [Candidatus Limnocylindrales bacterium]